MAYDERIAKLKEEVELMKKTGIISKWLSKKNWILRKKMKIFL